MARRDQADSDCFEARIQPEVSPVDDAKHCIDTFGSQHACHNLATRNVGHNPPVAYCPAAYR